MELRVESLAGAAVRSRRALAIGNFDGVHRGHEALLQAVAEAARRLQATPTVLTFDPHPASVLGATGAPARIDTVPARRRALARAGIECLATLTFDRAIASLTPQRFVEDVLLAELGAVSVNVGQGFRFGAGRAGDVEGLRALSQGRFEVGEQGTVADDLGRVSSSRLRAALAEADLETAERLLGRPFELEGPVVHGDHRGRLLGFPTANIDVGDARALAAGVYAADGLIEGETVVRRAAVNVGLRPTFAGEEYRVEAHFPGLQADLYGRGVRLRMIARLRPERRFDGIDALKDQIRADVAASLAVPASSWPSLFAGQGSPEGPALG